MNYIDDWLILAQLHQLAVRHRDVIFAHMKGLGLRLNAKKSVLSPLRRTTFLGVAWESTSMHACLSPARIESILSAVKSIRLGQSLTIKQFQNLIPFELLYMRPLQWWLKTKGFSPKGQSLSHDQGHAAMLTCLGNVDKTLVSVPGSHVGSIMSSQDAYDRCLSHRLGSNPRGMLKSGSVEGPPSLMAHQPSGDVGCISCSKEFPSRSQGPPCARPLRQHIRVYINHQGVCGHVYFANWHTKSSCDPKGSCFFFEQLTSRGVHSIGADILSRQGLRPGEWRLHPEVVELIWREPGISGSVCVSGDVSLSTLVLPHASSSSQTGPNGADVDEASSVCFYPDRSAPGSPGESSPGPGSTTSHCPALAMKCMVPRYNIPSRRSSSGAPRQEGPSVPSRGLDISPPSRTVETVGLASEGAQLMDSIEVVETILHSKAPSSSILECGPGKA